MNPKINYLAILFLVCVNLCYNYPQQARDGAKQASSSGTKSAAAIADEKCKKYMDARFIIKKTKGPLIGDPEVTRKVFECHRVEPLVIGGKKAALKEFPHMALIGFGVNIKEVEWKCGGSLISEQFVLSAAHCSANQKPTWVRLGELDISTTTDKAQTKDLKIIEEFVHPDYKHPLNYHDIILYKLHAALTFNSHIRPICLYTSKTMLRVNEKAAVTGWGTTGVGEVSSDPLLKATIYILDNKKCKTTYEGTENFIKGYNSSLAICAGDLMKAKDTCQGDSGGPLQIPLRNETCMYWQIGITSVGSSECGDRTPAVYTNVAAHIDWIQSVVWPQ